MVPLIYLPEAMMPFKKNIFLQNSRLRLWHNLLFFVLTILTACSNDRQEVIVLFENGQANSVRIAKKLIQDVPKDSVSQWVSIRLINDTAATNILGNCKLADNLFFTPLIPFTTDFVYAVFVKNKKITEFRIVPDSKVIAPEVVAIFPQSDTLPDNLLKLYVQFSAPMREGQSEKYIHLIKNGKDSLQHVFLDLQPELWNEDRTVITIWLDPGRIKRDLQPNQKLGAPLHKGDQYELVISPQWQSTKGVDLLKKYSKFFITGNRDSVSPNPDTWTLVLPKAGTKTPLMIGFGEALDHFLLRETISIRDQNGLLIKGRLQVTENDTKCHFIPDDAWVEGYYSLNTIAKLEDLSGNNLNRPFDRDITQTKQPVAKDIHQKRFRISAQ